MTVPHDMASFFGLLPFDTVPVSPQPSGHVAWCVWSVAAHHCPHACSHFFNVKSEIWLKIEKSKLKKKINNINKLFNGLIDNVQIHINVFVHLRLLVPLLLQLLASTRLSMRSFCCLLVFAPCRARAPRSHSVRPLLSSATASQNRVQPFRLCQSNKTFSAVTCPLQSLSGAQSQRAATPSAATASTKSSLLVLLVLPALSVGESSSLYHEYDDLYLRGSRDWPAAPMDLNACAPGALRL